MNEVDLLTAFIDQGYWIFSPYWRVQIVHYDRRNSDEMTIHYRQRPTFQKPGTTHRDLAEMFLAVVPLDLITVVYDGSLNNCGNTHNVDHDRWLFRGHDHYEFKKLCNVNNDLWNNPLVAQDVNSR